MPLTDQQQYENEARMVRGTIALQAYCRLPGVDADCALGDLFSDLMHVARERGEDPESVVRMAAANFNAEINGED